MPEDRMALPATRQVHRAVPHDSALAHATGAARYLDDLPEPRGMLHGALVLAPVAHGRLLRFAGLEVVRSMPGVLAVVTASDIPGENDISASGKSVEVLFPDPLIEYRGQPLAAIAADTMDLAREAAAKLRPEIETLPPVLDLDQALAAEAYVLPPMLMQRGDPDAAMAAAPRRVSGEFRAGGQEHFYLEGQIAIATPGEDGEIAIQSSTQYPTEVQHIAGRLLGLDYARIPVSVRRLGGGFGGKESNASWVGGVAALLAHATGRPVKLRLPRHDDMVATGKRHPVLVRWTAGVDEAGRILALDALVAVDAGHSLDLTTGVLSRAVTHVDNCYWLPDVRVKGVGLKTNMVSHTAFRGFGGPQGMLVLEDVLRGVANALGRDVEAVRRVNLYAPGRDTTPFGQAVEPDLVARVVDDVARRAGFEERRAAIAAWNEASPVLKRGIALFPLKFGISFGLRHLNQGAALVHVYTDGSIRLNHGGTEMGQGLFIKVAQVVAEVFGVSLERVRITPTSTAEVPNAAPTAASTGSDLNGWAAFQAASTIRERLVAFAAEQFDAEPGQIVFEDGLVRIGPRGGNRVLEFGELADLAWKARIPLSATGFYRTPRIHFDLATMKGEPYFYWSHGAAVVEAAIDTLTGESRVLRADLVQDCGESLNPAVDLGQIEGGFVQGMGWLTAEELVWDQEGRLRSAGPSTYKIPGSRDVPRMHVHLLDGAPGGPGQLFRSKAVGEPPLMLAIAVWGALREAVAASGPHPFRLDAPATPERVRNAVRQAQGELPV